MKDDTADSDDRCWTYGYLEKHWKSGIKFLPKNIQKILMEGKKQVQFFMKCQNCAPNLCANIVKVLYRHL